MRRAWARLAPLAVRDDAHDWFTLGEASWRELAGIDFVLARKDPPFDSQFLYDTMVLELAQARRSRRGQRPARPARCEREAVLSAFSALLPADR